MRILILILMLKSISFSQVIDLEEYYKFKEENKDMTTEQVLNMYPAGEFIGNLNYPLDSVEYLNDVIEKYKLTPDEIKLLRKNAFFVSGRFQNKTFFNAYQDIFKKDLPNYISADLILFSIHHSFQKILELVELEVIQKDWAKISNNMVKIFSELYYELNSIQDSTYNKEIFQSAYDNTLLYLGILSSLQKGQTPTEGKIAEIIELINEAEDLIDYQLFSSTPTKYDFSQFKVRGYYKEAEADNFFKSLMWLGRTELILKNAKNTTEQHSQKDLDIMLLQSVMLSKAIAQDLETYIKTDSTYIKLIGRQDNITPLEMLTLLDEMQIEKTSELLDSNLRMEFREKLFELNSANQSYSSNMLVNISPGVTNTPPIVFKVFGQRPIVDGFVTSQTTYDDIDYKGSKMFRYIPSTLDVSFALGNNASAQLLVPELNKYNYGTNLTSNRYLFDQFSDSVWTSNVYNAWLNILRSLNINDKTERKSLPEFAQTAAWNQKSLNTQLASWSQLRRNFLLSAKQPYTDSWVCSFPKTIVEPNPEFFSKVKDYINSLKNILPYSNPSNNDYFTRYLEIINILESVAIKQTNNIQLSQEESKFLQDMMIPMKICDPFNDIDCNSILYRGWFRELFFGINDLYSSGGGYEPTFKEDYTVADVHTIPQEDQEIVGKVLHAGVGPVNFAYIINEDANGNKVAYTGAVFSYYEYITRDYHRLDEDEWKEYLLDETKNMQPMPFTKYYSSDKNGNVYDSYSHFLLADASSVKSKNNIIKATIYPNPVKNKLFISLYPEEINTKYNFTLYDLSGNEIQSHEMFISTKTNYVIDFDNLGNFPKGVYFCKIEYGNQEQSLKFIKE